MTGKLESMARWTGRTAWRATAAIAGMAADATRYAAVKYWTSPHKAKIDLGAATVGAVTFAAGTGSENSSLSILETMAVAGAGGAIVAAGDSLAGRTESTKARASVYAGTFTGATLLGAGFIAGSPELREMAYYIPQVGLDVLAGYALLKLGGQALPAVHKTVESSNGYSSSRRNFIKTMSTAAAGIALGLGAKEGWEAFERRDKPLRIGEAESAAPKYWRMNRERSLEVAVLKNDTYESIAKDMTLVTGAALRSFNHDAELTAGGSVYVPVKQLKEEFRNLDDAVTAYLSADKRSLWAIANDYTIGPAERLQLTGAQRAALREENVRIMQRISLLADETKVRDDQPIIIPKSRIYANRLSEETLQKRFEQAKEDTSDVAPPPNGDLAVSKRYLNLDATDSRKGYTYNSSGKRVYDSKARTIDMIVLHTTQSAPASLDENVVKRISSKKLANYVIGRNGEIYMTVDPRFTAYHAGESIWEGKQTLSYNSVGIEIIAYPNMPGNKNEITDAQYKAIHKLRLALEKQYNIRDDRVLSHMQVAYTRTGNGGFRGRKVDPDLNFRWDKIGMKNQYLMNDPDILSGTIKPNPAAVSAKRITPGEWESFGRKGYDYYEQNKYPFKLAE